MSLDEYGGAYQWAVLVAFIIKVHAVDYLLSNCSFHCRNGSEKAIVDNGGPTCKLQLPHQG